MSLILPLTRAGPKALYPAPRKRSPPPGSGPPPATLARWPTLIPAGVVT